MRSNMPPRKPSCRPKGACTSEASPRSLVFFLPCFSLCRAYCASRLFDTLSRYTIFPISHHFPFCILPRFFMKAFAENASPMLVIKRICTDWSTGIKKELEPFSIQAPFIFQTITYNITYKRHKKIPLRIFILRGNSLKTGGGCARSDETFWTLVLKLENTKISQFRQTVLYRVPNAPNWYRENEKSTLFKQRKSLPKVRFFMPFYGQKHHFPTRSR